MGGVRCACLLVLRQRRVLARLQCLVRMMAAARTVADLATTWAGLFGEDYQVQCKCNPS